MSDEKEKGSYKEIVKATSIFGGVQVFNILIAIVRSKVIALLLGPAGMGIVNLLQSTTGMIGSITNLGLETSAVKNVSEAHSLNDRQEFGKIVSVFKRLVWITGLLGVVLTTGFAGLLSEWTFGSRDYTWSFILLSITLLINQLAASNNVILQGTRQLKFLASANMLGSVLSLFVTLPLYYFFGLDGIVPSLIMMALGTLVVSTYFSNKIDYLKYSPSWTEVKINGKQMVSLGFFLSLGVVLNSVIAYILRIYISNSGGVEDVGLYAAGFQIIGTYVGLVFTAMGTDYFPRLSAVAQDDPQRTKLVNQQGEVALLILLPIIVVFIFFAPWLVRLLYSQKFIPINEMIIWAAYGMFFKAASWAIAFQFLAKGASKLFFINELVVSIYLLLLNIGGYYYFGLMGLGLSYLITYMIYLFQVYWITKLKFNYHFSSSFLKKFLFAVFIGALSLMVVYTNLGVYQYVIGIGMTLVISWYAFNQIEQLTGLGSILLKKLTKNTDD